MLQTTPTIHADLTSTVAKEEYGKADFIAAMNNFWHFRCMMNPRLKLRGMWFPRSDEPRESEGPRSLFGTLPDQEPACPNRITSEAESRRRQEAYGWPRPGECASH